MIRVKISNFQSISSASFDIDGFTVIVGKNNRGKSAIIRAIDAALSNKAGGGLVNWDKPSASVSLDVKSSNKEEMSIVWEKGDSTEYKVNGKAYTKLNKAIPQPILDAGFKKLEISDKKFTPIVGHQFNELFLINEPGSVVTEVISTMYDFDVINDADIICQKKLRAAKSLLKTREEDVTILKEKLIVFKEMNGIILKFNEIKELLKLQDKLQTEINFLEVHQNLL
jgi:AAA15 family ATPase/GTPase